MDVILLLQGMYRESWMKGTFVEAAWQGYLEAGGLPVLEEAGRFLEKHGVVREFCSACIFFISRMWKPWKRSAGGSPGKKRRSGRKRRI